MAVVVTPTFCKQPWALPFLVVLTTSPALSESLGKRHKTIAMWAAQMIRRLAPMAARPPDPRAGR